MIIDFHVHLAYHKVYHTSYLSGMLENESNVDQTKFNKILPFLLSDSSGKKLIEEMDNAGISKSILLIIDGFGLGGAELGIEEVYELHYNIKKKYPDRLEIFAGVDPRRGQEGFKLFIKSVEEYKFKGIKLYPPMGYSLSDLRLQPFYEVCSTYNLPILIHTGPSLSFLKNEYAEHKHVLDIAKKFPFVNFIMAHAGLHLNSTIIKKTLELDNVYADISGFAGRYKTVNEEMTLEMKYIFDPVFNKKIVFGSDWPLFNLLNPLVNDVNKIKDLYSKICTTNDLAPLENVFYKNAMRILTF